jgi:hypothetical protein
MDQTRKITVNLEIREIARKCLEKFTGNNFDLVEQLFESKVNKLFREELPEFQQAEPNFRHLIDWFWRFHSIKLFNDRLGVK